MKGKLIIFSGPSGVGKDTLLELWQKQNPRVRRVIAFTSRDPRPGEIPGEDYHFVTRDSFLKMAKENGFLEYKEVHGNLYGTPMFQVQDFLERGLLTVLKIDVQGAIQVMEIWDNYSSVFIMPPSMKALEERIRARGTDDEAAIQKRLTNAQAEIDLAWRYHHQIINEDLGEALAKLMTLYPE